METRPEWAEKGAALEEINGQNVVSLCLSLGTEMRSKAVASYLFFS